VALGVLYHDRIPSYDEAVLALADATDTEPIPEADMSRLPFGGRTWKVE